MPWVRLEDTFYDHPKVLAAGVAATGLHVVALCYASAKLTDGFIGRRVVSFLQGTPRMTARLVTAGLWEPVEGGWVIHDFLDYNASKAAIQEHREKVSVERARAGKVGGIASAIAKQKASKAQANAQQTPSNVQAPTRTQPTTRSRSVSSNGSQGGKPHRAREPLLRKEQLDAWIGFGPEWDGFKTAWFGRGFMWPPYGSPEDDDTSQRGLLWSLLDARPTDTVRWVEEAPGTTTGEVIGYVLSKWHTIRDEAEPTLPLVVVNGSSRRSTPEPVRAILGHMAKPA